MSITRKDKHAYLDGKEIADEVWATPELHVAFSPATQELSLENLFLVVAIVKLSKTPEGMKHLKDIIIKYLDSCARIIESVQDACHSNWLTALDNQFITATIAHRIGLVDDGGYIRIVEHYRGVFDKMLISDVALGTLSGVTTLVQGSKAPGQYGAEGIGGLATTLKELLKT